ncbi:MAG: pentapeptide repeat-containing protein [Chloroflexota bacterium]|nr:pentapeptide repeat-containing protein [Chloroflexota bacterium]MDE3100898.1 pentapeptide repeat-containing protein [Chloroflexota bacterium]
MAIVEAAGLPGLVLLQRARVADVDFGRASFDRLAPTGCTFVSCDFRTATIDKKLLPLFRAKERNVFRDCRFDGVDLRGVDPRASRFEGCVFDRADMSGWNATTAEFVDCRFGGRTAHIRFYGRPWGPGASELDPKRTLNDFHGNDFSAAELVDVTFVMGIDIAKQRWPESPEYVRLDRIHQRLTRGRAEILRWKDLERRSEALQMLQSLSFLYMQQNDVVSRRVEPASPTAPDIQEVVWGTLARVL